MSDAPEMTVYGKLLWRHMDAARKDFNGPRRAKLYELIESFRAEFPDECKAWEDRYTDAAAALSQSIQSETDAARD